MENTSLEYVQGKVIYGCKCDVYTVAWIYDDALHKPAIVRMEGPYSWSLMFYRSFLNKAELYMTQQPMLKADALVHLQGIMQQTKLDPKLRVSKFLDKKIWQSESRKDLPNFSSILTTLDNLVAFEVIS